MMGKVYIVGGGPGDPGLITYRGLECLKKADVIVYDRLVNPWLLGWRKPDAELIYVGKLPKRHTMTQEEINNLLVEKAQEGKTVARLKGGDPFVFGRGSEEAAALKAAEISYEIIPGITSAIAAPAYAGIPVTHRGMASSFTVIAGHEDPHKGESTLDWGRLAADPGTLIFLMGVENLPEIAQNLLDKGKSPDTPAAIVRWGTRTEQEVLTASLKEVTNQAQKAGFASPAVIVIGQVANLRTELKWAEARPLFGKRILVTRAQEQAASLSGMIMELGGEPLEFPTIRIEAPDDLRGLDEAVRQGGEYDWIIFTSVNGVKAYFRRMRELKCDIRSLGKAEIAAIGPKTREALEELGLIISFMPSDYYAEAVLEGILKRVKPGDKVLIPRAQEARPLLAEALKERGLHVCEAAAYRTLPGPGERDQAVELFKNQKIDIITFTSSSTVHNLLALLGKEEAGKILQGIDIACIGPITAETVKSYGLRADVVAADFTIDGLVKALEDLNKRRWDYEFSKHKNEETEKIFGYKEYP